MFRSSYYSMSNPVMNEDSRVALTDSDMILGNLLFAGKGHSSRR